MTVGIARTLTCIENARKTIRQSKKIKNKKFEKSTKKHRGNQDETKLEKLNPD